MNLLQKIKKWGLLKKIFILIVFFIVFGLILTLIMNLTIIRTASKYIITEEAAKNMDSDCIIVPGAKANNGVLSPMLQDRVDTAIRIYKEGKIKKILMSGDRSKDSYDEVVFMKAEAVKQGVPSKDIFMDHAGFTTYQTIYRAKDVFKCKKAIVVTQNFHLSRALYISKKLGLESYGVNSDNFQYSNYINFTHNLREVLARNKAFIACLFKPKPTFSGKEIPIIGDGVKTDDETTQKVISDNFNKQ